MFPEALFQLFFLYSHNLLLRLHLFEETNVTIIANTNPIMLAQWCSVQNYLALEDMENW